MGARRAFFDEGRGAGRAGAASSFADTGSGAVAVGVAPEVPIATAVGGGAIGALEKAAGWWVGVPGGWDGGRKVDVVGALVTVVVLSLRGWPQPALLRWHGASLALTVRV